MPRLDDPAPARVFFPDGDIGELAVNGTVNDLAVGAAVPRPLSLAFILEEGLPLEELGAVRSDTAPLHGLIGALLEAYPGVHAMRDPHARRFGGHARRDRDAAEARNRSGRDGDPRPRWCPRRVRDSRFGPDARRANDGKVVVVVPAEGASRVLDSMRRHPLGRGAACIGTVRDEHPGRVVLRTPVGGRRVLDLPFAEQLPRIC